jgi:hypothetical protein
MVGKWKAINGNGLTLSTLVASLKSIASGLTTFFLLDPLACLGKLVAIPLELPATGPIYYQPEFTSRSKGHTTPTTLFIAILPFIIFLSIFLPYCFECLPSGLIQKLVLVDDLAGSKLASVLVVDQKLVVALGYMVRKRLVSLAAAAAADVAVVGPVRE